MVWKTGKFGVNNGRTVRSTRRVRKKRSEGLLIQTKTLTGGNHDEGEFEVITFSLGKQNRWLLPEVIKEHSAEEFEKEEEVVLVERYTNERNDRPDCFSVYNSKNSTTRKSKQKFARAKDLLSDIKEMKTRYEVTYPYPAGSWQNGKQPRRQTSHLGARKKNSLVDWNSEDDFEETNDEPDLCCHDIDEDFNEQSYFCDINRSVTLDLGLLLKNSSLKKKRSCDKMETESAGNKQPTFGKGDCIYVESSDMYNAHNELLAQIKENSFHYGSYQYDSQDWFGDDSWHTPVMDDWGGGRGRGRIRGRGRGRGRGGGQHYIPVPTLPYDPNIPSESSEPCTGSDRAVDLPSKSQEPSEVSCEQCIKLLLTRKQTNPNWLKEIWGEKYKEAASLPRAFILNASPETSQCSGEVFALFKLDDVKDDENTVKAQVSTVVACDKEGMHESVLAEFTSKIKTERPEGDIHHLEEILNIVKSCFYLKTDNKADQSEPRQPRLSLDVFTELFGWNSEVHSMERAQQEVKQSLAKKEKIQSENTNAVVTIVTDDNCQNECGICFMELHSDDSNCTSCPTSLLACGHTFCNSCWRAHLRTQIDQGHTDLQCPGYECNSAVDDVTVMSLVPSLYGRHLTKRLDTSLEMDPKWKWCPADQCKLVVKATTQPGGSAAHDVRGGSSIQPVPVVCVCGSMWCFKCQNDAHWSATCEEANVFRQKNEVYARMVKNSPSVSLITSVDVKNCPSCHYPIEKGPGCNHMHCHLCNSDFCWWCLQIWDLETWEVGHTCEEKDKVMKRQVELPISTKHLRSYRHFAVTSRIARSSTLVNEVNKKLNKLEKELRIYGTLLPKLKKDKPWRSSRAERRLNNLTKNNTTKDLREAFSFKFHALLALEGLAIVLSFMKDPPNKRLAWEFERLFFIIERMNEILPDLNKCVCGEEAFKRLKHFVACGKECLFVINRNIKLSIQ